MRQIVMVTGKTPEEFVDNANNKYAELSRFEIIREKFISSTSMYLIYDEPADPAGLEISESYKCAECTRYDWGKGCPYRDERPLPADPACSMFTNELDVEEGVVS